MMRFIKFLGWFLAGSAAVLGITLLVLVNLDFNDYKYLVEAEVREQTGRDIEIRGRLDLDLSLTPSIRMSDVRFANADWGSEQDMARLGRLEAKLDLMPFLTDGLIDIQTVEVSNLDLLVEKSPDGRSNLNFDAGTAQAASQGDQAGSSGTGAAPSEPGGISLPILRNIDFNGVRIRYRDNGTSQERNLDISSLRVAGEGPFSPLSITLSGEADGIPLALEGELGAPSDMLNADRLWTVDVKGDLAGTLLELSGGIDDPAAGRGLNLFFSAETARVGQLSRITEPLAGVTVPSLGPLKASFVLQGDADNALAMDGIQLELGNGKPLSVTAEGAISDLLGGSGIRLNINGKTPSIREVGRIVGQDLPDLGNAEAQFEVTGSQSALSLRDLAMTVRKKGGHSLRLTGDIADVLTRRGLKLDADLSVADIAAVDFLPDVEIPDLGPLKAKAAINGDVAGILSLSAMDLDLGRKGGTRVKANGAIADLLGQNGLDLAVQLTVPDANLLPDFQGVSVPDLGWISFEGRIKGDRSGQLSLNGMKFESNSKGRLNLEASGDIADIMAQKGIALDFAIYSPDLSTLSDLAQTRLPALQKLTVKAKLSGDNGGLLNLSDLRVNTGKSGIRGNLSIDRSSGAMSVNGNLTAGQLHAVDLRPLFSGGKQASGGTTGRGGQSSAASGGGSSQGGGGPDRVFAETPFALDALRKLSMDFQVNADQVVMPNGEKQKLRAAVSAKNGLVRISDLSLAASDAEKIAGGVVFDASGNNPSLSVNLKTDGYPMAALTQFTSYAGLVKGPFKLDIALDSAGNSPAAMASALSGHIRATAADALVDRETALRLMAGGPLLAAVVPGDTTVPLSLQEIVGFLPSLLGNTKRTRLPDQVRLHCMVADYSVANGIVSTNTLLLDSKYFTSTGTGTVDLGRERLDLTITPQRLFGISEVAATHKITGSLSHPVSKTDVAGSALGTIGNLLKIPSTTMKSLGVSAGENSPCVNLRPSNINRGGADQGGGTADRQPSEPRQFEDPEDALKEVGKELLKGLFGN